MSIVKNPILLPLQRLIGIAPNPKPVVLDDDNISLVLPMVPDITRRSRSGPSGGWFQGVLENVHSGADDEKVNINPYLPGLFAQAPYPASVGVDFDIWLAGASLVQNSGTAALTGAMLSMNVPTHALGWGKDDAGVAVTATPGFPLALWDSQDSSVNAPPGGNIVCLTAGGELTYQPIGIRLPHSLEPGTTLVFDSTSSGAAEFRLIMLLGLFPAGLGQDVVT